MRMNPLMIHRFSLLSLLMVGLLLPHAALAQDTQPSAATTAESTPASPDASDELLGELMQQREQPPEPIEPTLSRPTQEDASNPPISTMDIDLSVLGQAPPLGDGEQVAPLRREGEFVVNRKGRVVRAADANRALFAFDSDGEQMQDAPMILLPCQLLENMEQIIAERGDQTTFILTGQVFTYHGVNFLMPTMMKLAVDKGNLN